MPEPACVRPAAGGVADPAKECYGAVTLKVLSRQGRWWVSLISKKGV